MIFCTIKIVIDFLKLFFCLGWKYLEALYHFTIPNHRQTEGIKQTKYYFYVNLVDCLNAANGFGVGFGVIMPVVVSLVISGRCSGLFHL